MFIGLMNYIDRALLSYYDRKTEDAKANLEQAKRDYVQLVAAHKDLIQAKVAHATGNVARYKDGWIDLHQAERLKQLADGGSARKEHATYEQYGTARAKVRTRINARGSRVQEHSFGSRVA